MMKIYLFLILFLLTSVSSATSYIPPLQKIDTYYVGVNLGIDHTFSRYRFKDFITNYQPTMHIIDFSNPNVGEKNYTAGILIGAGKVLACNRYNYYLGGELALNYTPTNIKNYGSSSAYFDSPQTSALVSQDLHSVRLKNHYSYSAVAKLGWFLNPNTQTFILLGLDDASFEGQIDAGGLVLKTDNTYYVASPYHHVFDKNMLGGLVGIGMETTMMNHVSLRAQYTFTYFGDLRNSDATLVSYLDGNAPTHVTLHHNYRFNSLSRGIFAMSLIYYLT